MSNNSASPIEQAVQFLYEAVKKQVLSEVTESLGGPWEAAPKRERISSNGAEALPHRAVLKKGQKRDPKILAQTVDDLFVQIRKSPGERIEQISARLGLPTKDLALPVKKLLRAKKIRSKGVKRATRYFAR